MPAKTPLYDLHQASGGQIVDFHGWWLPLHYGSQLAEHHAVRRAAGMFDVSHMTIVDIIGVGGRSFLRYVLANDIDKLTPGKALYGCMLNEKGGIIDDLIVYHRGADHYRLVLNAATRESDLKWLHQYADDFSVGLQVRFDLGMLAVQGPEAISKTQNALPPYIMDAVATLEPFAAVDIDGWFIARTGYTGEDGFELILPPERLQNLWETLLSVGVQPCGLGARDTLRLEAGLNLYGLDMTEDTTPLESNLAWTVAFDPSDRDFIGRAALEAQRQQGVQQKLVGLVLEERGVLRSKQHVRCGEDTMGYITSGTFSPTLEKGIALVRMPMAATGECRVQIRDKWVPGRLVKPRFVKKGQSIVSPL